MMFSKNAMFSLSALIFFVLTLNAQETETTTKDDNSLIFFDLRGTNVADVGLGGTTLFGDYDNKEFGYYYRVGYKRFLTPNLFLGLTANGFSVGAEDITLDLMSYDFSLEILLLPYDRFTPIVYGGFGINTSSDVSGSAIKTQIGIGGEYIIMDQVGIKLFYEYNYSIEDDTTFLIIDNRNDKFLRFGLGVNYYFGGTNERQKRMDRQKTIINSNLLDSE